MQKIREITFHRKKNLPKSAPFNVDFSLCEANCIFFSDFFVQSDFMIFLHFFRILELCVYSSTFASSIPHIQRTRDTIFWGHPFFMYHENVGIPSIMRFWINYFFNTRFGSSLPFINVDSWSFFYIYKNNFNVVRTLSITNWFVQGEPYQITGLFELASRQTL